MPLIVVVCTGNINRSPLAACALRRTLGDRFDVDSAGFATENRATPAPMVAAAADHGVDLGDHRSRLLTTEDVEQADLVLSMDRSHPVRIADLSPVAAQKSATLPSAAAFLAGPGVDAGLAGLREWMANRSVGEFLAPRESDVTDPMGRSKRVHRKVAEEIIALCETIGHGL